MKVRFVNLVCDTLSRPVLHFYQVSLKYSQGYLSYRANMKSISNITRGHDTKQEAHDGTILLT